MPIMNNQILIMKNKLSTFFVWFFCLTLFPFLNKGQEKLVPLRGNINLINSPFNSIDKNNQNTFKTLSTTTLQIPFLDDFSYAPTSKYPNMDLWIDSNVFVNTTYAIAPPSIGVATFDGLNKNGYPYMPSLTNTNVAYLSDYLTSKPINLKVVAATSQTLQPSDSVALIFYYQARGRGENPEVGDSLIVDMFKPNQNLWQRVWSKKGNSSPNSSDTAFKRAFVRIKDTAFLQNGFQFRFKNYANTSGDFDNWHVDYILLNKNLDPKADSSAKDIAFGYIPTTLLYKYNCMPWNQYTPNDMAIKNNVYIRNNDLVGLNMTYSLQIFQNNSLLYSYNGGANGNLQPFVGNGWSNFTSHSNPVFNYTFAPLTDSTDFTIKHFIFKNSSNADSIPENDTVIQTQKFRNYFAYDDGSSEGGYVVQGSGGKLAQKYTLNVQDTLRALRIYFDPVGNLQNFSTYNFTINVWGDNAGSPGNVIYTNTTTTVKYINAPFKPMFEYQFNTPLLLSPGNYFIGFQQGVASGIPVGFDKNYNSNTNLFFDSGSGWEQSTIYGSVMMNPIFGKKIIYVGLNENNITNEQLNLFPNPCNTNFNIHNQNFESITIYNCTGQVINTIYKPAEDIININTTNFSNGIYLITCINKQNNFSISKKIIVQH